MKLQFSLIILALSLSISVKGQTSSLDQFFKEADVFLKKYIHSGVIDYKSIKNRRSEIDNLYVKLQKIDLKGASDNSKKAFFVNAYNLIVILGVIENYPYTKVIDQEGFFDKRLHSIAGHKYTLDQIEHDVLMKDFGDARLHFVLACGAISCPKLPSHALKPQGLDAQLDLRTKLVLNDPEFIKIDINSRQVRVSEIFVWYENHFNKKGKELLNWINTYRRNKIPMNYSISTYEFNWELSVIN